MIDAGYYRVWRGMMPAERYAAYIAKAIARSRRRRQRLAAAGFSTRGKRKAASGG